MNQPGRVLIPAPPLRGGRTIAPIDFDHDTDVFDVVRFVNVAFRNQPPEDNFCDPLAP